MLGNIQNELSKLAEEVINIWNIVKTPELNQQMAKKKSLLVARHSLLKLTTSAKSRINL